MDKEGRLPVRAFPMRMVTLATCAMVIALGMLGWTAYDGFRQSRETKQLVTSAQSLQSQFITMQQNLSAMLIMLSATGDIRWSHRYSRIVDDLTALAATAKTISEEFAGAIDRVVLAGIGLSQFQGDVVQLLSENQAEQARELVLGPAFKTEREAFQAALENLGREIEQLTTNAQQGFERRFFWTAIGAIAVLVCSAVVWMIAARRLREWRQTLDDNLNEIQRYEAELESRVVERTKAFEEAEGRLRATVDNMPAIVFLKDIAGRFILINRRYQEVYGPDLNTIAGKTLSDIYPKELADKLTAYDKNFIESGGSDEVEHTVSGNDGEIILHNQMFPVLNDAGEMTAYGGIEVDITERRRAEELLQKANKLTQDSIQYASRIQRSLLPGDEILDDMFVEHFCIWEPRDVVGGDMYWVRQDRRGYFVALFDCTGHGVPGALMTTIAVSALNVAFAETADPSRLISRVNHIVKEALAQTGDSGHGDNGASDDGLEMGVCLVEPERMRVTFAGARFELLSAIGDDIEVIKGDRSSLGYRHVPLECRFTNHSIRLNSGQRLYMYTDGITDQVGGNRRRSFGRKRIMSLLADVGHLPMCNQGEVVTNALADYQGSEVRRDDVSMIGFMPVR